MLDTSFCAVYTHRAQSVQAGTVNATAPSPNIRLRITDRNGADIIGAKLGDELYLRIEIDDDSVFGTYILSYVYLTVGTFSNLLLPYKTTVASCGRASIRNLTTNYHFILLN